MAITTKKAKGIQRLINKIYGNLDLDEKARDNVEKFLKKKLRIPSVTKIKRCEYFFTYKKNEYGSKSIAALYIRRNALRSFSHISREEMLQNDVWPNEAKEFLIALNAKKFTKLEEVFENI
jgi:hypothetical protein